MKDDIDRIFERKTPEKRNLVFDCKGEARFADLDTPSAEHTTPKNKSQIYAGAEK